MCVFCLVFFLITFHQCSNCGYILMSFFSANRIEGAKKIIEHFTNHILTFNHLIVLIVFII